MYETIGSRELQNPQKQQAIKQRINKNKQTDVSQHPAEQSPLKDMPLNSSTLWNEGMILQVLEGNDDESEFNSEPFDKCCIYSRKENAQLRCTFLGL